jgi:hypothetical protein
LDFCGIFTYGMAFRLRTQMRMRFIIVKRTALWTFRCLEQSCRDIEGLRVIWDRRRGPDRRNECAGAANDRRAEDRRRPAPHSWTAAGHVLAAQPSTETVVTPVPHQLYEDKLHL